LRKAQVNRPGPYSVAASPIFWSLSSSVQYIIGKLQWQVRKQFRSPPFLAIQPFRVHGLTTPPLKCYPKPDAAPAGQKTDESCLSSLVIIAASPALTDRIAIGHLDIRKRSASLKSNARRNAGFPVSCVTLALFYRGIGRGISRAD